MSGSPRVVIVDDHAAMRRGLELLLSTEGIAVAASTGSADAALHLVETWRPDVVIVDLQLADGDGLDLVGRLVVDHPGLGTLVFTGTEDPRLLDRAAGSGAHGLVSKSCSREELVAAVRAVAGGEVHVGPEVMERLSRLAVPAPVLSPREREILRLLADGLTSEQVASSLHLSPETVKTHVRHAMRKLGARTRVQAVAQAVFRHEIAA